MAWPNSAETNFWITAHVKLQLSTHIFINTCKECMAWPNSAETNFRITAHVKLRLSTHIFINTCKERRHGRTQYQVSNYSHTFKIRQHHMQMVYVRYFMQEFHQIYGHARRVYTVQASPTYVTLRPSMLLTGTCKECMAWPNSALVSLPEASLSLACIQAQIEKSYSHQLALPIDCLGDRM